MRERERKKQQELETAKEEQLRNEREARKKQDNIKTLGKTQEEIQQVEEQMIQLKNKKHQLFLQLKALITKEVEMENIRKERYESWELFCCVAVKPTWIFEVF